MNKRTYKKAPLVQTQDGIHLKNSILWFDSIQNGDLTFLSSALSSIKPKVPQVIATEETVRLLETFRKRPNALVCQYNRPFSIGTIKMELLPCGSILGGASLYVESIQNRILYAPQLQTQKIATLRQMQLKHVHTLVLGADHPDPLATLPSRKKERERIVASVARHLKAGKQPILLANPMSTAQEVTRLLTESDIPVSVHTTIHRVNRIYEDFGVELGSYGMFNKKHGKKNRALIFPWVSGRRQRFTTPLPDGPVLMVNHTSEDLLGPSALRGAQNTFYLGLTCDGPELRDVVSVVGPKELFFAGPYAKRYCEAFRNLNVKPSPLIELSQPSLF